MGSGSESHEARATALGSWLANRGVHLLTGGGGGVMESVSRAFHKSPVRRGMVIGVLRMDPSAGETRDGYPNEWVELPIRTHLPLSGAQGTDPMSRNHINVLTSDVIVALPGSAGTASEVRLAVMYEKPIIAFVESAEDIPDLPPSVARTSDLEGVAAFVEEHL